MDTALLNPPRRRGGRPAKEAAERRDSFVVVRVSPEEAARISARAAAAGMSSVSAFVRAAAEGVQIRARQPRHSPELVTQLRRAGNNVNQCLKEARFGNFPPHVADAAEQALRDISATLRALLHAPEH